MSTRCDEQNVVGGRSSKYWQVAITAGRFSGRYRLCALPSTRHRTKYRGLCQGRRLVRKQFHTTNTNHIHFYDDSILSALQITYFHELHDIILCAIPTVCGTILHYNLFIRIQNMVREPECARCNLFSVNRNIP